MMWALTPWELRAGGTEVHHPTMGNVRSAAGCWFRLGCVQGYLGIWQIPLSPTLVLKAPKKDAVANITSVIVGKSSPSPSHPNGREIEPGSPTPPGLDGMRYALFLLKSILFDS